VGDSNGRFFLSGEMSILKEASAFFSGDISIFSARSCPIAEENVKVKLAQTHHGAQGMTNAILTFL
jgi:hypothetical protein